MAYNGTTAATSVVNPPMQIARVVGFGVNSATTGGTGGGLWFYNSSAGSSDNLAANYFTDALNLGMKQGDVVIFTGCSGSSQYVGMGVVGVVSTSGAAIASTGGCLSSTR